MSVIRFTVKERPDKTQIREIPELLELVGQHFKLYCRYDANREMEFLDAYVFDAGTLSKDAQAVAVTWNGKTVRMPCSVATLKARLGKPEAFYTYNLGL